MTMNLTAARSRTGDNLPGNVSVRCGYENIHYYRRDIGLRPTICTDNLVFPLRSSANCIFYQIKHNTTEKMASSKSFSRQRQQKGELRKIVALN